MAPPPRPPTTTLAEYGGVRGGVSHTGSGKLTFGEWEISFSGLVFGARFRGSFGAELGAEFVFGVRFRGSFSGFVFGVLFRDSFSGFVFGARSRFVRGSLFGVRFRGSFSGLVFGRSFSGTFFVGGLRGRGWQGGKELRRSE